MLFSILSASFLPFRLHLRLADYADFAFRLHHIKKEEEERAKAFIIHWYIKLLPLLGDILAYA